MSYLSACISQQMKRHGLKAVDVATSTGIDKGNLSRILNDSQKSIRDEDLTRIAKAISNDPQEHAELVAARMKDACTGSGADLIEIRINDRTVLRDAPAYGVTPLSEKNENALRIIRENMDDTDVREVILGIAGLLDRPEESIPDYRKTVRVKTKPAHKPNR